MHIIRETEKDTQERVIKFFKDVLNYTYLGNWTDTVDENSNIIPEDLAAWLRRQNSILISSTKQSSNYNKQRKSVEAERFMTQTLKSMNSYATG